MMGWYNGKEHIGDQMLSQIVERISLLSASDITILGIILLLLMFATPLSARLQGLYGSHSKRNKMLFLRLMSLVLIVLYLLTIVFDVHFGLDFPDQDGNTVCTGLACTELLYQKLSSTGITLITSYFFMVFAQGYAVRKYGRNREIEGESVHLHTYQSELLSLVIVLVVVIIAFLTVLAIWDVEDWLRQTSVLGGLLLVIFFTKDIWLPDNINGLILLYQSDVEPGSLVQIKELNLLAVTLHTSLTQTTFRDMVKRHRIILPNSRFRNQTIEVLSTCPESGLQEYTDFKIGYNESVETVEAFLRTVWETACEMENAINPDSEPRFFVIDNGDHAVTWRLRYSVKNVYRLIQARCAISKAALQQSQQQGIGLNTPLTHVVLDK